jgi:RimJ/RimL family protein N-acetyltransferase
MQVFLETDRLVLRQFTMADAGNLVSLDADPDVMRFVTGGIPTSREEIQDEVLPAFLGYYQRYEGYGFWAAIEKATGEFLAGSISGHVQMPLRARSNSGTGCASQPGARDMPPRGRAH